MSRAHDADRRCACQAEHRPAPLELERHHVWPLAMGGSDDPSNVEWLCPTAHMNVHELMRFLLNGTLTTYADALRMYEQPVSRHAWAVAVEGIRRFREGGAVDRGRAEVAERVEAALDHWTAEAEGPGLVQLDAVVASVRAALRGGAA